MSSVDPFIGTDATNLVPSGQLAASWWWPKPQIGNTHPGATSPFGMVSACAFSGAYPTGYGRHSIATEGVPPQLFDTWQASGFTHFQQSGTGAIRKYYNYFRVTPMLEPLDALGASWDLHDEAAEPGYYSARLDSGVRAELTVGPKSAVHRYWFPSHVDARLVMDVSHGGLGIAHGRTVPMRADVHTVAPGVARGVIVVEGVPLSMHLECDAVDWRQMLWYDRRLMPGSSRLEFDAIRMTTLRPFGLLFAGPSDPSRPVELRIGFSLRGPEQAEANLRADEASGEGAFDRRRGLTAASWRESLGRIEITPRDDDQQTVFATALYHSLVKPCFAPNESPFWTTSRAFVFDIATMWDIYKTQLPLLTLLEPAKAVELATALLSVAEEEGNFPIGYRMARGADRFFRQASALAHTFFADLAGLGASGVDWENALVHLHDDLRRNYGEEYLEKGLVHPVSHTLDLADGYFCTAQVARHVGDTVLANHLDALAARWERAFDPATGLLVDSTFYEGGPWNYSFRLLHDMAGRIHLAGGDDRFVDLLDRFFGFDADPVKQLGPSPDPDELAAGYALNRFEGLNNEPDMEAPWAYHYAGRPDRSAEVIHAVLGSAFGIGRGGLVGNDDSGGLSSWLVWSTLGLFPVAGQSTVLVGAPAVEHARIDVAGGVTEIEVTGGVPELAAPARYVQSVHLDGQPTERPWLTTAELHRGVHLAVELGDRPSEWGIRHRPPSHRTVALD